MNTTIRNAVFALAAVGALSLSACKSTGETSEESSSTPAPTEQPAPDTTTPPASSTPTDSTTTPPAQDGTTAPTTTP